MLALVPHVPPASLRPLVSSAVGYRVPAFPTGIHRGVPSRHLTLVVELLAPLTVTGLERPVSAHGVAGGLHTGPALIDASRPQEGLFYGLTPLGARVLLGVPGGELRDRVVDLADVLGATTAPRLVERLHAASGWTERFRLLDAALLERLAQHRWGPEPGPAGVPAEVAEAWRVILASHGGIPVASVAAHVGWGRRHLGERFRAATGLTPKEAARVVRFERAQHALRGRHVPLADLAVGCGYADQPHLAREWRSLTGVSITTWLREELPFLQDAASPRAGHSLP